MNLKDYNEEPVYYCKACLSLNIIESDGNDICNSCGAVNFVSVVPFDEYKKLRDEASADLKA